MSDTLVLSFAPEKIDRLLYLIATYGKKGESIDWFESNQWVQDITGQVKAQQALIQGEADRQKAAEQKRQANAEKRKAAKAQSAKDQEQSNEAVSKVVNGLLREKASV